MQHLYTSTYCMHGLHEACRLVCKICGNGCLCRCHPPPGDPVQAEAAEQPEPLVAPR